jgi:hypothetical protein
VISVNESSMNAPGAGQPVADVDRDEAGAWL